MAQMGMDPQMAAQMMAQQQMGGYPPQGMPPQHMGGMGQMPPRGTLATPRNTHRRRPASHLRSSSSTLAAGYPPQMMGGPRGMPMGGGPRGYPPQMMGGPPGGMGGPGMVRA